MLRLSQYKIMILSFIFVKSKENGNLKNLSDKRSIFVLMFGNAPLSDQGRSVGGEAGRCHPTRGDLGGGEVFDIPCFWCVCYDV